MYQFLQSYLSWIIMFLTMECYNIRGYCFGHCPSYVFCFFKHDVFELGCFISRHGQELQEVLMDWVGWAHYKEIIVTAIVCIKLLTFASIFWFIFPLHKADVCAFSCSCCQVTTRPQKDIETGGSFPPPRHLNSVGTIINKKGIWIIVAVVTCHIITTVYLLVSLELH